MKKKMIITTYFLLCCMLISCRKETDAKQQIEVTQELTTEISTTQTTSSQDNTVDETKVTDEVIKEELWKDAYIEYINNDKNADKLHGYNLIYVDNDNIPEILEVGNCAASGCIILNYSNGKVNATQFWRLGFTYIEKENLMLNSDGNMDCYYDKVYSIIDGKTTLIAEGINCIADYDNLQYDAEGFRIFQFTWEGEIVEENKYKEELNNVFDKSKAQDGYIWEDVYTKEELIEKIKNIGEK